MILASVILAGYLALPLNSRFRTASGIYLDSFSEEWRSRRRIQEEGEMEDRFYKMNRRIPMSLAGTLDENHTVVIPPRDYLLRYLAEDQIKWVEPRWIYYFAGPIRTVPWEEVKENEATHGLFFTLEDGEPRGGLKALKNPEDFEELERLYQGGPGS